ncbi:pyruvate kinase [Fibrobacterota bacterium]
MNIPCKKTKIVATIGPVSRSSGVIEKFIRRGVNVFRLNFSHGSHDEHAEVIRKIRNISGRLQEHCCILADLQGPKIRTGKTLDGGRVTLKKGASVTVSGRKAACTEKVIYINYPAMYSEMAVGQLLLLNDGTVRLRVTSVHKRDRLLQCRVLNTGSYSSNKGVNLPDTRLNVPSITKKDREDLRFALAQDINFVALSFVRKADDMRGLVRLVNRANKGVECIAKIERPEALENFSDILDACDGIMVARGDLGVETSPYNISIIQKDAIAEANRQGKIVIVATQMLESMVHHPVPTRAETTDVANAILDGTDAVMLSGETAAGEYPVQTIEVMNKIATATEASSYYPRDFVNLNLKERYPPHSLCEAAGWASRDLGDVPVVVYTASGETARYLSKIRNQSCILAFTPYQHVAQKLALSWNITSFVLGIGNDLVVLQRKAEAILLNKKMAKKGELLLIVCGGSLAAGATNLLKVKKVGEE